MGSRGRARNTPSEDRLWACTQGRAILAPIAKGVANNDLGSRPLRLLVIVPYNSRCDQNLSINARMKQNVKDVHKPKHKLVPSALLLWRFGGGTTNHRNGTNSYHELGHEKYNAHLLRAGHGAQ